MSPDKRAVINMDSNDNLKDVFNEMLKFKCHLCNKYLSVAPIYVSKDGTKYQCGRCKDIKSDVDNRCMLFEHIAKFFTFPCIYTECKELLLWKKVQNHEKCCAHRTMSCPVYYSNCDMEIKSEKLVDHMKTFHEVNIHEETMIYNLKKNHRSVNVLVANGVPFLIFISYTKVYVVSMEPNTFFTYNLKLNKSDCSLSYEKQILNEHNDIITCCECSVKKCTKIYHPYSKYYSMENTSLAYTSIDMDVLDTVFDVFSELKFIIEIFPSNNSKKMEPVNDSEPTSKLLNILNANIFTLRRNFECPVCFQFMLGSIFSCQTGHSICNKCKLNIGTCPLCQSVIGSLRNFSLEHLAENLNIPCSNQKRACSFTGNLKDICIHEEDCLEMGNPVSPL